MDRTQVNNVREGWKVIVSVDLCANPRDDDLPKAREFEKHSERMDSSDGIDKYELKGDF